ncbi:MAG: hypothetical protein FWD48_05055 [Oscillospiraceae bacterium]|nr:hypothetical protein [Oscillospiraceae bacterium]
MEFGKEITSMLEEILEEQTNMHNTLIAKVNKMQETVDNLEYIRDAKKIAEIAEIMKKTSA